MLYVNKKCKNRVIRPDKANTGKATYPISKEWTERVGVIWK